MKPYKLKPHEKRDIVGGWDKRIWVRRARTSLVPPFCWLFAEEGGGPVLKGDTSWRKLSGIQFRFGTWQFWLSWRKP
jgi:hypothetical protein